VGQAFYNTVVLGCLCETTSIPSHGSDALYQATTLEAAEKLGVGRGFIQGINVVILVAFKALRESRLQNESRRDG